MKFNKKNKILLIFFAGFLLVGLASGYMYRLSPFHIIHPEEFQQTIIRKELHVKSTIDEMMRLVSNNRFDSLINYTVNNQDITYYVFEDEDLIFWSDNQLDISSLILRDFTELHYIQLPNAYCVVLSQTWKSFHFIALITIKYNYPYENDKLINRFAHGFNADKNIGIRVGSSSDKYPVYCMNNHYLFSLVEPDIPVYNETYAYISAFGYVFAFLFFFILYFRFPSIIGKNQINIKNFLVLFFSVGIVICFLLYNNIPSTLFNNNIFTPFDYASYTLLASIAHLSIFTGFILFSVCLFFFHVKIPAKLKQNQEIMLLCMYVIYFIILYAILRSLIFHSSIQLNILHMNNFTVMGVWAHVLLFLWGIGLVLLFFKTHNYFMKNRRLQQAILFDLMLMLLLLLVSLFIPSVRVRLLIIPYFFLTFAFYISYFLRKVKFGFVYLIMWSLVYSFFICWNLLELNIEKNISKYRILAQNVYINGNIENDPIADILLEELDNQLLKDFEFQNLLNNSESVDEVTNYLNKTYFRGFWDKYEIHLNKTLKYSEVYYDYINYIDEGGTALKRTHFYSVPTTQNAMTYIGVFLADDIPDSVYYFMEFYPRRQYKSYSFPDLLIPASANIHSQLNTSIAKYDNDSLTYASGTIDYPFNTKWIPVTEDDFSTLLFEGHWHYVYKPNNDTFIVVSKQQLNEFTAYMLFFFYLMLIYFVLSWIMIRIFQLGYSKNQFNIGLTARFQYSFILLLIVSFIAIFYVSVDFIRERYESQQIDNLENKKLYIQKALQDIYFFNQDLNVNDVPSLDFDLSELSYTYQTDIHVFDNDGVLIGSSLPLIFNRHLVSNRMPPIPYFSDNPNIEQYENIGELNYLVAYADFYNGDYLQIGYIAVPLYFSQKNMQDEIVNFSSVIIHIYLVIILFTVLLTLFIGQRLSAPLSMLEKKLKEMRLGRRNEKIDYKLNDEIGQLVAQYNRTVDELEQSAKLLAESERESAWRSMARQVAHEINNPLTPMKLSIQQLQRRKGMHDENFDEYFKQSTAMLIEQIDNLSRIAGTFSNFARMPEAKYEYIDITSVLKSVVNLFKNNNETTEIIYKGTQESIYIYADAEQLIQVFNNLIKNAIQSIPYERKGVIVTDMYEKEEEIIICVHDNGTGIPEDVQDKLFVPNFTTKSNGMGLGLAISKNIILQLDGSITFETRQNAGSTFIIRIPIKDK